MRPLAIDLYAGLGGWSDGLLAEGYDCVGFDIERHQYGDHRYPAQLVVQDVMTLHGSQFKGAALIVASPPCQEYSYMAMPWKLGKAKAGAIRADTTGQMLADLNRLFDACFRIQAQASLAAGHHVPMVVENVRGAQRWVGRARWSFGSYYLWGDVPALMPQTQALKQPGINWNRYNQTNGAEKSTPDWTRQATKVPGFRFDGSKRSFQEASREASGLKGAGPPGEVRGMRRWTNPDEGYKSRGMNWSDPTLRGQDFTRVAGNQAGGVKHHGSGDVWFDTGPASLSSKSAGRKAASAMIAKIPFALSRHIAAVYFPRG